MRQNAPFSQLADLWRQPITSWLGDLALAYALAFPCIALLPFFGLRNLPFGVRAAFSLVLTGTITPFLIVQGASDDPSNSWVRYLFSGLPVALTASSAIWAATMAGNLLETLQRGRPSNTSERQFEPLGVMFSLAAMVGFLQLGGPSRLCAALQATSVLGLRPLLGVASRPILLSWLRPIISGISVAISVAAPLLAVHILSAIFDGIFLRTTRPSAGVPPLRGLIALGHLTIVALLLDRIVEHLLQYIAGAL